MVDKIKITITQADLQRLDAEDKWVEVEDGEIIESEDIVPFIHVLIIQNLFRILDVLVRQQKWGLVFTDGARYILEGTPDDIRKGRKPDFSFIRAERFPANFDWSGDFYGAPDLVVEVASPGQTSALLLNRISVYLAAGSEEAWLIYPQSKTLYQYRRDAQEPNIYREDDTVDTSRLFPGLTLVVCDLFVTE